MQPITTRLYGDNASAFYGGNMKLGNYGSVLPPWSRMEDHHIAFPEDFLCIPYDEISAYGTFGRCKLPDEKEVVCSCQALTVDNVFVICSRRLCYLSKSSPFFKDEYTETGSDLADSCTAVASSNDFLPIDEFRNGSTLAIRHSQPATGVSEPEHLAMRCVWRLQIETQVLIHVLSKFNRDETGVNDICSFQVPDAS